MEIHTVLRSKVEDRRRGESCELVPLSELSSTQRPKRPQSRLPFPHSLPTLTPIPSVNNRRLQLIISKPPLFSFPSLHHVKTLSHHHNPNNENCYKILFRTYYTKAIPFRYPSTNTNFHTNHHPQLLLHSSKYGCHQDYHHRGQWCYSPGRPDRRH